MSGFVCAVVGCGNTPGKNKTSLLFFLLLSGSDKPHKGTQWWRGNLSPTEQRWIRVRTASRTSADAMFAEHVSYCGRSATGTVVDDSSTLLSGLANCAKERHERARRQTKENATENEQRPRGKEQRFCLGVPPLPTSPPFPTHTHTHTCALLLLICSTGRLAWMFVNRCLRTNADGA